MARPEMLAVSLERLSAIAAVTHNVMILPVVVGMWQKHLQPENPLWRFAQVQSFDIDNKEGAAHCMAMVDERLPGLGLVGYFACTTAESGAAVLAQACAWLRRAHAINKVYGPINGTATSDYRLNMAEDFWFPGEPVNPALHIDAFQKAGFSVFNQYVSGMVKHYRLFTNLFMLKPRAVPKGMHIRAFDPFNQMHDLRLFHDLMVTIFPSQSVYCPVLSWEERVYNMAGKDPFFNPNYTYFLEDECRAVGVVVAYPYNGKLILKTIGLLPEYRGRRLSNLLIHRVHEQAHQDGLEAAVYAMVRVGNRIYQRRRPGVAIVRRYVTMQKIFATGQDE